MPKLPDLTEPTVIALIREMTARAAAFGTVAIPLTGAEYAHAIAIGAVEFLSPFTQGGGVVSEYRAHIGGLPLHITGGAHVRAA